MESRSNTSAFLTKSSLKRRSSISNNTNNTKDSAMAVAADTVLAAVVGAGEDNIEAQEARGEECAAAEARESI